MLARMEEFSKWNFAGVFTRLKRLPVSIRPAAGRLSFPLFVRQCSILSTYHQYTVALELRIFSKTLSSII